MRRPLRQSIPRSQRRRSPSTRGIIRAHEVPGRPVCLMSVLLNDLCVPSHRMPDGAEIRSLCRNPTVATLTLLALGSSGPEILLSITEAVTSLGEPAPELGLATITGSAIFNLMMIPAVCSLALPNGEFRAVSKPSVYWCTAFFAVEAYGWVVVVLSVWTPGARIHATCRR